jgi:hypothetical protein
MSNATMTGSRHSALDRHTALAQSDDGFPWFAGAMLAMESSEVVRLRLEKFARCEADAGHEAHLMVQEKIAAAFEAAASFFTGATPGAIVSRYREHVAANVKRLSP